MAGVRKMGCWRKSGRGRRLVEIELGHGLCIFFDSNCITQKHLYNIVCT